MFSIFHKKIILLFFITALVVMPVVSLAGPDYVGAQPPDPNTFPSIVNLMNGVVDLVWKIFFAIAVIMFVVAGIEFLTAHGDPTKVSKAKAFVIWGIVGIVVAVAAFSIVKVVTGLLVPGAPVDCSSGVCDCNSCRQNCQPEQCA